MHKPTTAMKKISFLATTTAWGLTSIMFVMSGTAAQAATVSPTHATAGVSVAAVPAAWTFVGVFPTKALCVAAGEGVRGIAGGAKAYKCTEVTISGVAAWDLYTEY
jgi:hypothetical protein